MPYVGGVFIPDDQMPSAGAGARGRPELLDILGAASEGAVRGLAAGLPYQFDVLTKNRVSAEDEAAYKADLAKASEAASRAAPASVTDLTSGKVGIGRFAIENLVGSLPYMVGGLVGGVAGGAVGGLPGAAAGAVIGGTPQFAASNVQRAVEENGELTVDAAERAALTAPVQAASDALVGRFLPGVGKILGPAAATQTGGFLTRTAKSIVKAGATEAVTEAAQQMGERYAAGIPLSGTDAVGEYVNAAVTAFAVGGMLGAGGGFRRSDAVAKPASMVTPDDLSAAVDNALNGTPAPLALPAPADFHVGPDGVARTNPSGRGQLYLPSPDQFASPDVYVDAAGRASGELGPVELANQPRVTTPDLELGAIPGAMQISDPTLRLPAPLGPPDLIGGPDGVTRLSETNPTVRGLPSPAMFGQNPEASPAGDVMFQDANERTSAEVDPVVLANLPVASELTPEQQAKAELETMLDTAKKGLRGGFVQKVTADTREELLGKVYDQVFVEQDTRANTAKFAQRLGILDENLQPTELAKQIEAQRAGVQSEVNPAAAERVVAGLASPMTTLQQLRASTSLARSPSIVLPEAASSNATIELAAPAVTEQGGVIEEAPVRAGGEGVRTPEAPTPQTPAVAESSAPAFVSPPTTVDPKFQSEWATTLKDAGVEKLNSAPKNLKAPPNLLTAQEQVMQALATDEKVGQAGVSQVEKLARKIGLVTDDDAMDITPLGRRVFLRTHLRTEAGMTEAVQAAGQQGFTGAQASQFERGARAVAGAEPRTETFDSFESMNAYLSGEAWAKDFVNSHLTATAEKTAGTMARQAARETGVAVDRKSDASRRQLSPLQLQQQASNLFIDSLDLRAVADTDIATMRRMAREGATPFEIGKVAERVQGGKTTFRQPSERAEVRLSRPEGRGQPVFKEMARPDEGPGKSAQRVESEAAVRAYDLRNLIRLALAEKGVTQARADKLNALLDEGKVDQVARAMKSFDPDAAPPKPRQRKEKAPPAGETFAPKGPAPRSYQDYEAGKIKYGEMTKAAQEYARAVRMEENYQALLVDEPQLTREAYVQRREAGMRTARAWLSGDLKAYADTGSTSEHDGTLEMAITGKSFLDVAQHMIDNAHSPYMREIMLKVRTMAQMLDKYGMSFDLQVLRPGDAAPAALSEPGVKGLTYITFQPKATATVYLKGAEFGFDSAINQQVVAHEMVHATTQLLVAYGRDSVRYGKTPLGKAVKNLDTLLEQLQQHLANRRDAGKLNNFEQRLLSGDNNVLDDADELLAWTLTNPEMQRYLNRLEYKPGQSLWSRLVEMIRTVLGVETRADSVLGEVLRTAERIYATPRAELQGLLMRNDPAAGDMPVLSAAMVDASAANRTVEESNNTLRDFATRIGAMADAYAPDFARREFGVKARRWGLGWISHNQLNRAYGDVMPGVVDHSNAHDERQAIRSRWEQLGTELYQTFEKLEREKPNAAKWVNELMALSTEFQIDPDKAWEDHTHHGWVTDASGQRTVDPRRADENARLRPIYDHIVQVRNNLRRDGGAGMQLFNDFRAYNEAQSLAHMASDLHGLVALDPELSIGVVDADINPADEFMRDGTLTTMTAVRDRWQQLLARQIATTTAFVDLKKGEVAGGTEGEQAAMHIHLSPIEQRISAIHEALASARKAPYFHLGRFGDYFGAATVKTVNGQADPAAMRAVGEALERAGFTSVQMSEDNARPRFMMRFETLDQAERFQTLMNQLKLAGHLDPDADIQAGPRNRTNNYGAVDGLPGYVAAYIRNIETSAQFVPGDYATEAERAQLERAKNDAVRLAVDTYMEQMPDTSVAKVMTKRYTVAGYNKDMVRNFTHRARVGAIGIANRAAQPKFDQAFKSMQAQVNEATTRSVAEATKYHDIMTELKLRDATNPINEDADVFDKARAVAHSYFLGLSPAYALINLTQLGVVALPELAKKHGYKASFHAIRRASGVGLKIMRAVAAEAGQLGWKHGADVAITDAVLNRAGLSQTEREFVNHMMATGKIDISSAARALGQIAENRAGSRIDIGLKYASAMGLYTETFTRLTAALAARDLHQGEGAAEYAASVVSNAMFDYQSSNTARQLGKKGFLGPVTPMVTQFMSYSVQLTEKLYSEMLDSFAKARPGESAEAAAQRRTEARRFMLGHLTAVTALAGTLGLPFATVFATVIERLVDAADDDDDPYDATAAWRGFLADVFGRDVAEVLARGLPRAFGLDVSARTGEQNLMPFSEFLADRRSWKDAVAASAGRSLGAVPSMITNVLSGGEKLAQGDVLGGLKEALPVAFKGPIETYRMTTDGYVDTKGNKLPLSPTGSAYLWQLLGFSPAAKAEYGEARSDQQARRGEIARNAETLRKQIVAAVLSGDDEGAQELIGRAQEFDQDNPAYAIVPSLAGAIQRRMQTQATAKALHAPAGVPIRDIAGQEMTSYANY